MLGNVTHGVWNRHSVGNSTLGLDNFKTDPKKLGCCDVDSIRLKKLLVAQSRETFTAVQETLLFTISSQWALSSARYIHSTTSHDIGVRF